MEDRFVLEERFDQIGGILGKSTGVHQTKVGTDGRPGVGGGFSTVVKAGPNIDAAVPVVLAAEVQSVAQILTPVHNIVIVAGTGTFF